MGVRRLSTEKHHHDLSTLKQTRYLAGHEIRRRSRGTILDKNHFSNTSSPTGKLTKLQHLSMARNRLRSTPQSTGNLVELKYLCNIDIGNPSLSGWSTARGGLLFEADILALRHSLGRLESLLFKNGPGGFQGPWVGAKRLHHHPRCSRIDRPHFHTSSSEHRAGGTFLYSMSKDQHGCRYMQRKLEEGDPAHISAIFGETCPHFIEFMTDPFGNYLCQKLFENCSNEQRTALINT